MSCLVIGSGLSGIVIAERLANILNKKVIIVEKRDHIGGNCYDYVNEETGIRLNKYGAHLFHTNNEEVWNYVNSFDDWVRWEHKVLANVDDKFVSIPVNITTVNELCGEHLQNENEMIQWLEQNQVKYDTINNSEEMAKSKIGTVLYDKLIKDYTFKQWNKYPEELDKCVLTRIPIHTGFDTRYFKDKYQALPKYGYTHFCQKVIEHANIDIKLETDYHEFIKSHDIKEFEMVIFTGPIDSYFTHLEKLEYRSINFTIEVKKDMNYFQPNSVVNYSNIHIPYTRTVEYKHFLNQKSKDTIIVSEQTSDIGEPYYPVLNKRNLELYEEYKKLAKEEEKNNVFFIGRLANYKYFNMDEAILNALEFFKKISNLKLNF
jgi:UDP-galactopyranose mutase